MNTKPSKQFQLASYERAVLFIRVNHSAMAAQAAASTIERQRAAGQEAAGRHGVTITREYVDTGAGSGGRAALDDLIRLLTEIRPDVLITADVSRLTRSLADYARLKASLDALGVSLLVHAGAADVVPLAEPTLIDVALAESEEGADR
jgi:DNA invertase Pin-like site-specific DNA recombinase